MLSTGRAYDLLCVHDEALIDQRHVALLAREALVVPVAFFKAHKLSATLTCEIREQNKHAFWLKGKVKVIGSVYKQKWSACLSLKAIRLDTHPNYNHVVRGSLQLYS